MKLTPKQKAFCEHYIKLGNASEAARLAGYSKKTAYRTAQENLQKPAIKTYIAERMDGMDKKIVMDADEAIELLTSIARGETTETVVTPSGKKETKEADINQRLKAVDSLMKRFNVVASLQKTEAETEFIREKTKLLKGASKDTSLLEALIDTVKNG